MTSRFIISATVAAFMVIALSMVMIQKSASDDYRSNVIASSNLIHQITE